MTGNLGSAHRWLASRPGYMILTAGEEALAAQRPERFRHAWVGLMLLSIAWGIASAGLWGLGWKVRTYSGIPFMPVAAVIAPMVLWLYRRSVLSLSEALVGTDPAAKAVGGAVIVVVIALSLLELNWSDIYNAPFYLPPGWGWLCPIALYRALILAPVWGAWAMMITCQFCRCKEHTEPAVAALAGGCGALASALCLAPPLAVTLLYFHFLPLVGRIAVVAATFLAAVAGGMAFCRVWGGLNRRALLAVNLLTQIVFLLAYLANR